MPVSNNQSNLSKQKENRTHVIAVRVTEAERKAIEKQAYESRKKPPRVLLDAFFNPSQNFSDCTDSI